LQPIGDVHPEVARPDGVPGRQSRGEIGRQGQRPQQVRRPRTARRLIIESTRRLDHLFYVS